jgi:hypothetical protein
MEEEWSPEAWFFGAHARLELWDSTVSTYKSGPDAKPKIGSVKAHDLNFDS